MLNFPLKVADYDFRDKTASTVAVYQLKIWIHSLLKVKRVVFDRLCILALQMWPFSLGSSENQNDNSFAMALGIKAKIKTNFSYS